MFPVHTRVSRSPPSLLTPYLNRPPIYGSIFSYLSLRDLIRFSWTCTEVRHAVNDYMSCAFSINRLLSRFFDNPQAFRQLQARTGTLISGSQALQFFCRTYWPDSDLDLYTLDNYESILEIGHLIQRQGYIFAPYVHQEPDFAVAARRGKYYVDAPSDIEIPIDFNTDSLYVLRSVSGIYSFEKRVPESAEVLKVQIIAARCSPLEAILDFHSTVVMNFISWEKAYSLYPYATCEKGRSLYCVMPQRQTPQSNRAIVKYHDRGFVMVGGLYPHEDPRCAFRVGPRCIGDKDACIMPLDNEGVEWTTSTAHLPGSSMNIDPYLSNGWELREHTVETTPDTYFEMKSELIYSSIFCRKYIVSPPFLRHVMSFMVRQGSIEHRKFRPSDASGYHTEDWSGRKYYDEELADIVRTWIDNKMPDNSSSESLMVT